MKKSLLYTGKVRHRRFYPRKHAFNYSIFMHYFDLLQIQTLFDQIKWCSVEKFNWLSFYQKNHLNINAKPLDQAIREYIFTKTGKSVTGKIFLLTQLACLGYCFNPISIYFVFTPEDKLEMLVLEVTNTPWGERHYYILDEPTQLKDNIQEYHFQKKLHVSPFMKMDYVYRFIIKKKAEKIILHMENLKDNQKHFDATLTLSALELNDKNMNKVLIKHPLMQYKIIFSIYWQALKLWIKGTPFQTHPKKTGINL